MAITKLEKGAFTALPLVTKSIAMSRSLHERSHVCRSDLLTLKIAKRLDLPIKTFSFQIQDQTTVGRSDGSTGVKG
ncbi:hypothetical protein AGR4C_Cc160131 [Agrobacterium tumefaciens str. Kerr 14]|uniref:Uncharacterized protein n=1 Tax=Agrobacterium tumefaciens str. Kerr 14 TaxID=1183424 RepID=A0A1S7P6E8_AGRTU|nr:hypothetical protein AGR4C_Cc160131 [Agrobacterium tumefaciens str. Kerr 14]